ncbi:MAG: AMP-binding protein [Bacteroidales bacterium]|nr:AMP-binding protein [Bacteroidales bacterium]MDY6000575.1 AMP-binding protein [Candidatus Cryptobacteroides sp.]
MGEFQFKSVNKLLENSFRENWERMALSNYQGTTLCYRDVARRIEKLHITFEKCFLHKGDKVAICAKNQINWGVSFLATITYGAVAVPILADFKASNIHYLVNHSEAKVLFVDDFIWENLLPDEMPGVFAIVRINTFQVLYAKVPRIMEAREHMNEYFGQRHPNAFLPEDLNYYQDSPNELAMINYTSGTSGFSKGVMVPYRAIFSNIQFAHEDAMPLLNNKTNVVSMLPLAHMYGMMFEFFFEMSIGAHVHFLTRIPSPKIILQALSEVKPDVIIAVPLIIEKVYKSNLQKVVERGTMKTLLKMPVIDKVIQKKINTSLIEALGGHFEEVILGGAAFNKDIEKFFYNIGFPYTVGYGMTECAPIITYAHYDKKKLYSCGRAAMNMQIRIDSSDPENIDGEIQCKGPNLTLGYYKNPSATKELFTDDGWMRTGDIGIIDKDGYLFIRGRSKCMILGPNGQNIYPEELESVINSVAYVVDSLVIEDNGGLTALIYPDYHRAELNGLNREDLEKVLSGLLPQINAELTSYAQIRKMEFMPEDFERTPKSSIKRYLYQRNK